MGVLDSVRLRLSAALAPNQMIGQLSKPRPVPESDFGNMFGLSYQEEKLTYEDYDKMLMDPQIKSGYELIRMFLLSRQLIITPASDSPENDEIADALDKMIDCMDYPMRKVRNDIYSALPYGYSVSEIIWEAEEDTEAVRIARIRPISIDTLPHPFIYNEETGELETILQTVDDNDPIEIPAEKCLVYSYDECFGDRMGTSILDAVYENWFQKQKLLQYWNVYLQKHEGPTLAAFIEDPTFKEEVLDGLEAIHEGRTNITMGQNDRIEVVESSHRGEGFKEAIEYHDNMIFRKMNIGTMILGQENGNGAYAQSQTQNDVLNVFLDGIHADVAAELQIKLNEWVDMHYDVEEYPTVAFEPFEDKDLVALLNSMSNLVRYSAIDPTESWFKQLIGHVVEQYTDISMDDIMDSLMGEQEGDGMNQIGQPKVVPTADDLNSPNPAVDLRKNPMTPDAAETPAQIDKVKKMVGNIQPR